MMKIANVFLAAVACMALAKPAGAQCTLPALPGAGTSDPAFDAMVVQNGPGWTGADGSYSLALPNGNTLWLWSDSYIGTVNPATRRRSSSVFQAHNSLTVEDPEASTFTTVGYPASSGSYFVPRSKQDWFWLGGAFLCQPSAGMYQIKVMLLEWTGTFAFKGNSVATLSYPSLSIISIEPIALQDLSVEWGTKVLQSGGYYYIYGIKDPGTANKLPYLARIASIANLNSSRAWQFWNSSKGAWLAGESNGTAMIGVPAITNEYSVDKLDFGAGSFYLIVGMDPVSPPFPLWQSVTTYYSCLPQGPWSARTVVYSAPEAGAPGCSVGTLVAYNAKAHIESTDSSGVLISYNVNANSPTDLVCANDYLPRFIRVPIAGASFQGATRSIAEPLAK